MKTLELICALFMLTVVSFNPAQAEGFQGIRWGASIASIKENFPEARQDAPSTDMYAECKNPNGSIYKCSVDQLICADRGWNCFPPLRVQGYQAGDYIFELIFSLSKARTLSEVSLNYSGDLIGQTTRHGKLIYEKLLNSLEAKYGKPSVREPYSELASNIKGMHGAYGFYQWKVSGNKIGLIFSSRFDPKSSKFVDVGGAPSITIIYSPLVDETASRL